MHSNYPTDKGALPAQLAAANAKIALLETQLKECRQHLAVAQSEQTQKPGSDAKETRAPPPQKQEPKSSAVASLDGPAFKKHVSISIYNTSKNMRALVFTTLQKTCEH